MDDARFLTNGSHNSSWVCDSSSGDRAVTPGSKDLYVQLIISLTLGVSAFLAFCVSLESCRPFPPALSPAGTWR